MPHTIVIFGASGDLTSRKLIPALFSLYRKKRLPEGTKIVGSSRSKFSHDQWRNKLDRNDAKVCRQGMGCGGVERIRSSRFITSRAI